MWWWVLIACGAGPTAVEPIPALPEPPGVSRGMQDLVDAGWVHGVDVILFDATRQTRIAAGDLASTPDGVVEYGSLTKLFVGTAFAALIQEGALEASTPVGTLLPELSGITGLVPLPLSDLASHRTKLPASPVPGTDTHQGVSDEVVREHLRKVQVEPLSPDDLGTFTYSNTNYVVLGWALEAHTGTPWQELVDGTITGPLGLTSVAIDTKEAPHPKRVPGHRPGGAESTPQHHDGLGAARALVGTVEDLATFGQAFLTAPAGVPASLGEALSDTLRSRTHHVGIGWWLDAKRPGVRYHSGITPGFTSWLGIDPEAGIGVVVVASTHNAALRHVGPAVLDAARGKPFVPPLPLPVDASIEALDACTGTYGAPDGPQSIRVHHDTKRLIMQAGDNPAETLFLAADGRFHAHVMDIAVSCEPDRLDVSMQGRGPMPLPKIVQE